MNKKRWISIAVIIVLLVVYVRTEVISTGPNIGKLKRSLLPSEPSFSTETYQEGAGTIPFAALKAQNSRKPVPFEPILY